MPHSVIARHPGLCAATAVCSVLLSLWAWHADPIINNDGTQYVRAAAYFADGDWQQGLEVYKWPFYSILSGLTAKLSGTSPAQAAYGVNAVLYVLLAWGFLALVRTLGGSRCELWIGAAIVLLHPALNEYRSFIIRDIGFWAFYLWSLAYLFHYVSSGSRTSLLVWAVTAVAATLFRVEGLAFLALLPFALVARRTPGGTRRVVNIATVLIGLALVVSAVLWQHVPESAAGLSGILDRLAAGWAAVGGEIESRLDALAREFPGAEPGIVLWLVFLLTLGWMVLVKIVRAMSVMYAVVAGYSMTGRRMFENPEVAAYWWIVVLINLAYLCAFALINFFLTDRYPFALGLTLLACVPFGLRRLWEARRQDPSGRRGRWLAPIVAGLIVAAGIRGLSISTGKYYLKDAGLWLKANMGPEAALYSNERRIIYYAGADSAFRSGAEYSWQEAMQEIWSGRWRQYDYMALNVSHNEPERAQYVAYKLDRDPVRTFKNKSGDEVLIFAGRSSP